MLKILIIWEDKTKDIFTCEKINFNGFLLEMILVNGEEKNTSINHIKTFSIEKIKEKGE